MNSVIHSQISVRKRGGIIDDYLPIHNFIDSTKQLCSDNRHRILHTMWGINQIVVPIFGHTIINSDNKRINTKDLCEQDHVLPDYQNRFIPTLTDFVKAIDDECIRNLDFEGFFKDYCQNENLRDLMLSPLTITGKRKSLLITHNSWFVNFILPKIFNTKPLLNDFNIGADQLFDNMNFELWMDNGSAIPKSAQRTAGKIVG